MGDEDLVEMEKQLMTVSTPPSSLEQENFAQVRGETDILHSLSAFSTASTPITGVRGGPLFVPGYVSRVMNVRKFQGSCVTTFLALQAELDDVSAGNTDDDPDLLVDDLRIVSDPSIVSSAMERVFQKRRMEEHVSERESERQMNQTCKKVDDNDGVFEGRDGDGHVKQGANDARSIWDDDKGPQKLLQKKRNTFDHTMRASAFKTEEIEMVESFARSIRTKREEAKTIAYSCLESLHLKTEEKAAMRRENRHNVDTPTLFCASAKVMAGNKDILSPTRNVPSGHYSLLQADSLAVVVTKKEIPVFEVNLWVQVHGSNMDNRHKRKVQDFLVLGSQLLTDLRDQIYCVTDELVRRAGTYIPSGYFLIENVFYNDLRDPQSIDYSMPILEWIRRQYQSDKGGPQKLDIRRRGAFYRKRHLPVAADMACTQFLDLDCRLGMQYVYCHQGDCKHSLIIRDARLVHKEDAQNMLLYPMLHTQLRLNLRKCSICSIYRAKRVTYDDRMAPSSPCFFCDYCYYLLHYTFDGQLLYNDFKVYDYND